MTVTPEDRLKAAMAKLDQPRAETFRFIKKGDEIAGTVVRLDVADTDYGSQKIVVIDPGDGNLRSIWLLHDALLSQMEKLQPQVGDVIAVRYLGRQQSANGRNYHAYTVATDRERPQFEWGRPTAAATAGDQWAASSIVADDEDSWRAAEWSPSDDDAPYDNEPDDGPPF